MERIYVDILRIMNLILFNRLIDVPVVPQTKHLQLLPIGVLLLHARLASIFIFPFIVILPLSSSSFVHQLDQDPQGGRRYLEIIGSRNALLVLIEGS